MSMQVKKNSGKNYRVEGLSLSSRDPRDTKKHDLTVHPIDHHFKNTTNYGLAFLDAVEEAIRPIRGLSDILCGCENMEFSPDCICSILDASIKNLDYILKKHGHEISS